MDSKLMLMWRWLAGDMIFAFCVESMNKNYLYILKFMIVRTPQTHFPIYYLYYHWFSDSNSVTRMTNFSKNLLEMIVVAFL